MDSRESHRLVDGRSNTRVAILVLLALTLFGVGILVGRSLAPSEVTPGGMTSVPADVDSSSIRSQQGAIDAATAFAQVMSGPSGDATAYRSAMAEIAAPEWRNRAAQLAENAIAFVREQYGDGGRISFHALRYRVQSYTNMEATVDIWGSVLASGPKLDETQQSWVTASLRILWVQTEWKVAGQSSRGGPTPQVVSTDSSAEDVGFLEDFTEYEHAPRA